MAEMGVAAAAWRLGAAHEEAAVDFGGDGVGRHRLPEARPAGPGIELGFGTEEGLPTTDADISPGRLALGILAAEASLYSLLPLHLPFLHLQFLAPFSIGLRDL